MKTRLQVGVLLLAALWLHAGSMSAGTYTGTITETVTETNDPDYHVGDVFSGFYTYESPNGDIEFSVPGDLVGDPLAADGMVYSTLPGRSGLRPFVQATHGALYVSGGDITQFFWVYGDDWRIFSLSGGGFFSRYQRWMLDPPQDDIATFGTVSVSSPHSTHVPDTAATWRLLAISLMLLVLGAWVRSGAGWSGPRALDLCPARPKPAEGARPCEPT